MFVDRAMAPRAESLVVAVDVGRTLGEEGAKEVLRIARSIVTHKVLYGGKNDSVCVVLFGAASTRNALHDEMASDGQPDQYVNILVLKDLSKVGSEDLKALAGEEALLWGGTSDHLDVLTVAFDVLCKDPLKSAKRIVVISDFMGPIKEVDGDFVGAVVAGIQEKACAVELVSLAPITESSPHPPETRDLVLHLVDTVASLECASDAKDYASLRGVKHPVSVAVKHGLAVGSFEVPVGVYKKVSKASMSTNLKVSNFYKDERGDVWSVKRETEFRRRDDPDGSVVTDKAKAFPYGKDLIPVDEAVTGYLAKAEEKSLRVLGFHERGEFPQHRFLGSSYALLADPKSKGAQLAVSALVRACEDEDQVMVARRIARGGEDPSLCALVPRVGGEGIPDHFVMCTLPFREDIREYPFASLNASEKWVPSEEELGLAGRIIGEMSLAGEDGDLSAEQLVPERMANPSILNMNGFIAEKLAGAPNGKPECGTGSSQLPSRTLTPTRDFLYQRHRKSATGDAVQLSEDPVWAGGGDPGQGWPTPREARGAHACTKEGGGRGRWCKTRGQGGAGEGGEGLTIATAKTTTTMGLSYLDVF